MTLEDYFSKFRNNIIGIDYHFNTPYGIKKLVYSDWIASGRMYNQIETRMLDKFYPLVGNTHSESSISGTTMTKAYKEARNIIKKHVNASEDDVLIFAGYGMTAAINKFQRILGLSYPEQLHKYLNVPVEERPVLFLTHMEHHSNQTSWLETICDVVIIEPDKKGLVDLNNFEILLKKYLTRKIKIGSFTAASNVTGVIPPYQKLAKLMHQNNGIALVDFAASAPYVNINMHPADPEEKLDAIFFSPHKFLGGPGTSGVFVFDKKLYNRAIPDQPGGGTVDWTNPWGEHQFIKDIEAREDGGTPGFLQAIKSAMCVILKEEMGVDNILLREEQLLKIAFERLTKISKLHILAGEHQHRLGIISFYVEGLHYNLLVKLLNDRFGIQMRGGCSCAGTYGHYLLHVDPTMSKRITDMINNGDLSEKPGWVRFSLHPTMTDEELNYVLTSLEDVIKNAEEWQKDYNYSSKTNEFTHKDSIESDWNYLNDWFILENE